MNRLFGFVLIVLLSLPFVVRAQSDPAALEAYINDHKQVRSLLLARSTLELSNQLLHDYSKTAAVEYKELNVELDKYTRAFDVIDVLYQSLRTSMNMYDTYNNVSDRISDYKNLLEYYNENVIKRGKIRMIDTLIISVNKKMLERVYKDGKELYKSVSDLVLYATGAAACSTNDLMLIMASINMSLDNIEITLNRTYFETWRFIQLRMGYWKEATNINRSKLEITNDALVRWKRSSHDALIKKK
ncbi:hypothetical protein M1P97_22920 [Parabacteroides sp. GYB001]|uniref:hypothetical protein n=1 Tax=Parabacteroides leei TaxID=2939491 RepID=UPI0020180C8D|nr:hypothetical protein [Parabacteroides leei]MCL3854148.1 hypothetical protein [Parabacteroides leei]